MEKVSTFNYFSLFGIDESFDIDIELLEKRYIALQRACHANNFILDVEKAFAVQNSIEVNKAYETLRSNLRRAEYLLSLNGEVKINSDLSVLYLEEIMDLRERNLPCDDILKIIESKIDDCIQNLSKFFAMKDFQSAAVQSIRLKYLENYKKEKVFNDAVN